MLQIIFKNKQLEDLYQGKKVDDKRFKSNPNLVKQYIKTVNKLKAASNARQLTQLAGLNYEALLGDLKGRCSVRINDQYRIIFEEIKEGEEVKILALEEISNHYS